VNRIISLPEDLVRKAEELAALDQVSLEEFLSARLAEQLVGLDYLQKRAGRASRAKFEAALDRIPEGEPDPHDCL
jgi:hypothetical protein